MFQQAKQVTITYLTYRWIWFIGLIILIFIVPCYFSLEVPLAVPLGVPCLLGLTFVISVTKWQFANPRARLLPGYTQPHLLVFGMMLLSAFILNPLLISVRHGVNPGGPLAFTLLIGACALIATLLGRGVFIFPALLLFYSGFSSSVSGFWFDTPSAYHLLHFLLATVGSGIVGYCIWHLAQLTEEMDEYQVMPIGGLNFSRVERAEQRRLVGQQIKKQRFLGWLNDRWLDRGLAKSLTSQHALQLPQYGIARNSGFLTACYAGIAYALYGLLFIQLDFIRQSDSSTSPNHPPTMFILFTVLLPAAGLGLTLMQHRPRMAQELLFPASRIKYFDNLLIVAVLRSLLLWVGLHVSLWLIAYATNTLPQENATNLILQFIAISLVIQFPAYGLCLRFSLWNSQFSYIFGMYVVTALQMAVISFWWRHQADWTWLILVLALLVLLLLASLLIAWARRKWLAAELG